VSDFALPLPDDFVAALADRVRALVPDQPERRFLSKRALAEHYGVAERTTKTWRERGCPAHRVGRVLMFDVAEVDRWIESHA
jgi:phage terminase Nu1 subunit (DNA packaging protein)